MVGDDAGMSFGDIDIALLIAATMVSATPILLAALGEAVVEKAGVLNLGVEGMMIVGAVASFIVAYHSATPWGGFLAAALAGAGFALLFGFLTQILLSNQVATGLALTLFGLGIAALLGKPYEGMKAPTLSKLDLGVLSDIPFFGEAFFRHDAIIYLSLLLAVGVWFAMTRTRAGLILRGIGENQDAAHSLGYKVVRVRLLAIAFGGSCAGLGGAYLSLVRLPQWTEGMTAGAGWIALALVVFGSWRAERILIGAYLFGGLTVLQLNLQAAGVGIGVEYLSSAPYLVTIAVLVFMSSRRGMLSHAAPASLGKTFEVTR